MAATFEADASPEKRLFISLITRDISLIDAIIDLTDNSVNAAMKSSGNNFNSAKDFQQLITKKNQKPAAHIEVKITDKKISISDSAVGIDFSSAKDDVFKFGHPSSEKTTKDRLSVYGIGMKRAVFKAGNRVKIISDHKTGGFSLDLNVATWEQDNTTPWKFDIEKRPAASVKACGTSIEVTELYDDVKRRISDGRFLDALTDKLSRVYAYFLGRIISITVNGKSIQPTHFDIGNNNSSESFEFGDVTYNIVAGIPQTQNQIFKNDSAGWYVFCNGRTVVYADKTKLTGWDDGLPIFQPKHRPFIGLVFFVSPDPEELPWTTTKGSINEDSMLWQQAKRHMVVLGRTVTSVLDKVYNNTGTDIQRHELAKLSGATTDAFSAAVSIKKTFKAEVPKKSKEVKIQFGAKESDLEKIRKHLSKPSLSGSEIGRYTFKHFLKNEVGST